MKNEIVLVAKLQHKDLVRLLGFCMEKKRSSSSTSPARQQELSWGQRKKIIEGIGKGLTYLHEDSRLTVIHRDLKADNILLDVDMNPKISDFGLAKLFSINASDIWHRSMPSMASSLPSQTFTATASLSLRSSPSGVFMKIS
nr:unnamed protein product [Digitaria exilis]